MLQSPPSGVRRCVRRSSLASTLSGLLYLGFGRGFSRSHLGDVVRGGPKAGPGRAECGGIPGSLQIRVGRGCSGGVGAAGCVSPEWTLTRYRALTVILFCPKDDPAEYHTGCWCKCLNCSG